MRSRLCFLVLLLVPLLVYGPALLQEFGTPEDFLRLTGPGQTEVGEAVGQQGILHGALLEISFGAVEEVMAFGVIRGISLLLIMLCGLALWQLLHRGGWSELDATLVALGVGALPTAQLLAGWGAGWPAALAALLALAGFAAVESELELGGGRRRVAMLGGVLLYFAAAMCYLPTAAMALVPLAALTFTRPLRLEMETKKWFSLHVVLLFAAVFAARLLKGWMMTHTGMTDETTLAGRIIDLFTVAVPSAGALFWVNTTPALRVLGGGVGLALIAGVVVAARRQTATDERIATRWWLALAGGMGAFSMVALLTMNWRAGYHSLWPASGILVVAVMFSLRGLEMNPKRRWKWPRLATLALIATGLGLAYWQTDRLVAAPLAAEWQEMRTKVLRANFPLDARVQLVVAHTDRSTLIPRATFSPRVFQHAEATRRMFAAALRERFLSGMPKGQRFSVVVIEGDQPLEAGVVRIDLR